MHKPIDSLNPLDLARILAMANDSTLDRAMAAENTFSHWRPFLAVLHQSPEARAYAETLCRDEGLRIMREAQWRYEEKMADAEDRRDALRDAGCF